MPSTITLILSPEEVVCVVVSPPPAAAVVVTAAAVVVAAAAAVGGGRFPNRDIMIRCDGGLEIVFCVSETVEQLDSELELGSSTSNRK